MVYFLLLVGLFSFKTVVDSGQFKKINPHFNGECESVFGAIGAEDILILNDSLAIISSDPRRKVLSESNFFYSYESKNKNSNQGSIFSYNINSKELIDLTSDIEFEFHPHGISSFQSINGLVFIAAVNHTSQGHYIEIFELLNNQLLPINKISDELLVSPNDLVMIDEDKFYVTNDHGSKKSSRKLIEDYLQLSRSNVLLYDSEKFVIVIDDLQYANGINVNLDKKELYVSETIGKQISVYQMNSNLQRLEIKNIININSGLDNIDLDSNGNLWIGSHPKLFDFVKHAKNSNHSSPSQVVVVYLDKNSYKEVYLNDGNDLSGSSVAVRINNNLLIGSVFEENFLHCYINE